MRDRLISLCLSFIIASCAALPSPEQRRESALHLATQAGWQAETLQAGAFSLLALAPAHIQPHGLLTLYIEGDGFAWLDSATPSADPTPLDPVGLRLALRHPEGNAAYLARSCQFVGAGSARCRESYWTDARFAPEVVAAMNQAVDVLRQRFGAQHLQLIGYSGGGAIAELVAARRNDVVRIVTVAGNLDLRAWTSLHGLRPLTASLDPADQVGRVQQISQWHFAGEQDRIIPPALTRSYAERFPPQQRPVVRIVPGYDHHCCWAESWPQRMAELPALPGQ